GVLYFLASRASCCAYCKGVRPARLITTSFVSSGVGVEVDLSAFAASALPQASAKVSTSSVIGKFLFENRKVHATRARVKRRRPPAGEAAHAVGARCGGRAGPADCSDTRRRLRARTAHPSGSNFRSPAVRGCQW